MSIIFNIVNRNSISAMSSSSNETEYNENFQKLIYNLLREVNKTSSLMDSSIVEQIVEKYSNNYFNEQNYDMFDDFITKITKEYGIEINYESTINILRNFNIKEFDRFRNCLNRVNSCLRKYIYEKNKMYIVSDTFSGNLYFLESEGLKIILEKYIENKKKKIDSDFNLKKEDYKENDFQEKIEEFIENILKNK